MSSQQESNQANSRLTGKVLLAQVRALEALTKAEKARACGYVTRSRSGTERVQLREFMSALIEAQGIPLEEQPRSQRGRRLTYRASVQQNGTLVIGSRYTQEMNLRSGDRFHVQLSRTSIKLMAIEDEFDNDAVE